jgi:hypothetical protein
MGGGAVDESIGADTDAGIATGTFEVIDGTGSGKDGDAEGIVVGGVGA